MPPVGKEQEIREILDKARTGEISVVEAQEEIQKIIPIPENPDALRAWADLKKAKPGITRVYEELLRIGGFIPGIGPVLKSFAALQELIHESGIPLSQRDPGEALLRGIAAQFIPPKPESILGGAFEHAVSFSMGAGAIGLLRRAVRGIGVAKTLPGPSQGILGASRAPQSGVSERLMLEYKPTVGPQRGLSTLGPQLNLPFGAIETGKPTNLVLSRESFLPEQLDLPLTPKIREAFRGIQLEIWDAKPLLPEQLELKLGNPGTRFIQELRKRGFSEPRANAVLSEIETLKGMPPPLSDNPLHNFINYEIPKTVLEDYFRTKRWLGRRGWMKEIELKETIRGIPESIPRVDEAKLLQLKKEVLDILQASSLDQPLIKSMLESQAMIKATPKGPSKFLPWSETLAGKVALKKMEKFKARQQGGSVLTSRGAVIRGVTPQQEAEELAKEAIIAIPSITRKIKVSRVGGLNESNISSAVTSIKGSGNEKAISLLSEIIEDFNANEVTLRQFFNNLRNLETFVSDPSKFILKDIS